jgi:hypothetical protein
MLLNKVESTVIRILLNFPLGPSTVADRVARLSQICQGQAPLRGVLRILDRSGSPCCLKGSDGEWSATYALAQEAEILDRLPFTPKILHTMQKTTSIGFLI